MDGCTCLVSFCGFLAADFGRVVAEGAEGGVGGFCCVASLGRDGVLLLRVSL